jgi:hypothetical protein
MPSTWAATAGNQLITGAALRDGATATGFYTVDVTIPTGDNLLIVSSAYIAAHTTALGVVTALQCPTKDTFLSQF